MDTSQDCLNRAQQEFQKALDHLKEEFGRLNIGRANISLIEGIKVDAYGQKQDIKSLATLSVADARTLQIQPWDRNIMSDIMRALQSSDMHFNPVDNGTFIRIVLPPLTAERRQELAKVVHRLAEEARISIRHARHEIHAKLKSLEKENTINEDELHKAEKRLQESVDAMNEHIAEMASHKEKDIMTI